MTPEYREFLARKAPKANASGLADVPKMHAKMKPHQRDATEFCLRQGRAGLFLDTGLGKTFCELEFAKYAAQATNHRALILTPLAVAKQIEREGKRFGYDARVIREQADVKDGISICNYDRLDKLDPDAFGVIVLDESSILKSFTGKTTRALIGAFAGHRFRLAATATPAPNDHMELGQHSEFLGIMDSNEMLARWFISDQTEMGRYRLKGHAAVAFYDWMASWSRMAETPADMGHDASEYILPALNINRHKAHGTAPIVFKDGLFAAETSATTMFDLKRQTSAARADVIAGLVAKEKKEAWVIWCDTNDEADALLAGIPGATEVRGSQSIEEKEEKLAAFALGEARVIISKPSISGFGVNWQHCARMALVGRTFSYEAWYQAVRRCWRFGQTRDVQVHIAVAEGEDQIGRVIDRKGADHARMKRAMSEAMQRSLGKSSTVKVAYDPQFIGRLPSWLTSAA